MPTNKMKIDSGETMAVMWDGYFASVYPTVSPDSIQGQELKQAFYSGAYCLFNWFMVQLDEDAEPTDADVDRVEVMHNEIASYMTSRMPTEGSA